VVSDPSTVISDLGDDNLAVHLHGRVVDVDVDSFDPLVPAALDMCLPQSPLTWGRRSKPKSHRLYVLDEDFDRGPFAPLLRVTKALEIDGTSLSVEVRGGERASGFVSVLPGSQHPGGELYTWDALDLSSSPAVVRVPDLISSVRLALAAAMVARFWVSGVRNDMSLALSGALWRMHALMVSAAEITDADPPDFSTSMNRAELLLRTVMELAGDDPADARDRVTNLRNTWRKLERDPSIRTVGATRMAELIGDELGQQVVRRLYLLLADDAGALKFDELTERFRIWYGQGVLIDLELVRRGLTQFWMTKEQAANSMGGGSVLLGGKKVLVSRLLFSSLAVGRVYGVTFDPTTTEMVVDTDVGALVNQWRGFRVKPHPEPVSDDDIRPFLAYVFEVVASGDEKAMAWVLDWCADILQCPGRKPGTALVLVGPPGAGKTFLGECVMGAIIGSSHYGQTNSIASLTDRFNQLVDNKVLLQCDEAMHAWQRDLAARLKALVTDLTLRIEPKFVNPFIKPNHMRFLFTSNEETAALFIDATPTERRFTVLKVSDRRQEDVAYWEHLRGWTENNLPRIARWLMDRRYNKAALNRPYSTSAKRAMQSVGMPMEAAWLVDRVQSGFPLSPETHVYWWQAFHTSRESPARWPGE
jgi:hypothetical protein